MLRNRLTRALLLLAASFGCAVLPDFATCEPQRLQPGLTILQRLLESERHDETSLIEVKVVNPHAESLDEVVLYGIVPKGYRLRAATLVPTREKETLAWALGAFKGGETKELRLQWEPLPSSEDLPLECHLRAVYRGVADSAVVFPGKQVAAKITVSIPEPAAIGVPLQVRIGIANPNHAAARDVVLQATFAPGLSHALGKELENALGSIEAGQTRTVPLELIPTRRRFARYGSRPVRLGRYRGERVHRPSPRKSARLGCHRAGEMRLP